MNLFDYVNAANVVAYWIEKNVNEQPLLGETLFPYQREVGIKLDWIKGASNQPVALRLSAYDSEAIRRDRQGIESYTTKMPFFKESMYIDEELRQDLNTLLQANNTALINQIVSRIFNDQIQLINAAKISLERMRMELLGSGTITLAGNGQSYNYDFGIPNNHKITVSTSWSNPDADVIKDITDIVDAAKAEGINITRGVCNSSVINDLKKNNSIRNQIYVLAGGAISSISAVKVLDFIKQETGVTLYAYDNVYVNEQGTAVKYVADNTISFIPDGTLGATHMGTTPEESDLGTGATSAVVSVLPEGIAVTSYGTEDPVNVELKVSMVGMPSFERANEVYILDTEAE